jgi:hypothetical protein
MHRVLRALGSELVRSDAAPLQAQLEEGGGPKVCGTATEGMGSISKSRGVGGQRRGFELLDQLFGIDDEVAHQVIQKIVTGIQLAQAIQVREIEGRTGSDVEVARAHGIRQRQRRRGWLGADHAIDDAEKLLNVNGLAEVGGDPGLLTLTAGFVRGIRGQSDEGR